MFDFLLFFPIYWPQKADGRFVDCGVIKEAWHRTDENALQMDVFFFLWPVEAV